MTTSLDALTDDLLPPHDMQAERFTLSAMIQGTQAVVECAEIVSPGDFLRPLHREVFLALVKMFAANEPITPVTLSTWLARDRVPHDPMYLYELYAEVITPAMGGAHAKIVWEHAVRRRISEMGRQLMQLSGSLDQDPAEMLANATRMINHAARHATPDEGLALSPVDFLALTGRSTEPVIDGLLDHQERFIVVGGEGSGKTTALHQMAFALAAGQHPFCGDQIKPGRALIIDLENPVEILKRRFRKLRDHAMGYPGWDDANIGILARPGGIDLTSPGQAFKLAEVIRLAQPDLIIAGPIYKMLPGGEAAEWHHTTVTRFWDVMRARYDCAIGLETHAPMQSGGNGERIMRPLGSGVWSRWPEFGLTLASSGKHTLALKRFRGDREEGRSWPDKLVRNGQGGWPWAAVYPPGTFTSAPPAILG